MKTIDNQFCIFTGKSGISLIIDDVKSCISDEKIFGSVSSIISKENALVLGHALIEAALTPQEASSAVVKPNWKERLNHAYGNAKF